MPARATSRSRCGRIRRDPGRQGGATRGSMGRDASSQGRQVPWRCRAHPELQRGGSRRRAARGLAAVGESAATVKANPDSAQLPVRQRALEDGKTLYMAVPAAGGRGAVLRPRSRPPCGAAAQGCLDQRCGPVCAACPAIRAVACRPSGDGICRGRGGRCEAGQRRRVRGSGVRARHRGRAVGPHTISVTTVHELQLRPAGAIPLTSHDVPVDSSSRLSA